MHSRKENDNRGLVFLKSAWGYLKSLVSWPYRQALSFGRWVWSFIAPPKQSSNIPATPASPPNGHLTSLSSQSVEENITAESITAETIESKKKEAIRLVKEEYTSYQSSLATFYSVYYENQLNNATDDEQISKITRDCRATLSQLKKQPMDESEIRSCYSNQRLKADGFRIKLTLKKTTYYNPLIEEISAAIDTYEKRYTKNLLDASIVKTYIDFNNTLLEKQIKLLCAHVDSCLLTFMPQTEIDKELKDETIAFKGKLLSTTDEKEREDTLVDLEICVKTIKRKASKSTSLPSHSSTMPSSEADSPIISESVISSATPLRLH